MITREQILAAIRLARRGMMDLNGLVEILASLYVRTQARLEGLVLEALLKGDIKTIRQRRAHLAEVRQMLHTLANETHVPAKRLIAESYRLGERHTATATTEPRPTEHGRMRAAAVTTLTDNLEHRLGDARVTVGRRVEDVFRREGLRAAMTAVEHPDESLVRATLQMQDRLVKEGVTAFVDGRGARWNLDTYSTMAVRTAMTDAVAQGAADAIMGRGFDLVEIYSGESACPQCEPFLNKTWSLSGRSKKYKRLPRQPSYHPNCDCVVVPSPLAYEEREEWRATVAA